MTPRKAASIVLLRDSPRGLEVFLQRRTASMSFAAGMTVFPGGGIDARDEDDHVEWIGPSEGEWARRLNCSPLAARTVITAAVRETFEECGVLLAGTAKSLVTDTSSYSERQSLASGELSLAKFLAENQLAIRTDLLHPWAHWVTPTDRPRRYDTHFFVAVLPQGQQADDQTSEAVWSGWQRPAVTLREFLAGTTNLMAPTWLTLDELSKFTASRSVFQTERSLLGKSPIMIRDGNAVRIVVEEP